MPAASTSDGTVPNLCDQVRAACAFVASRSHFVRINHEHIPAYAESVDVESVVAAAAADRATVHGEQSPDPVPAKAERRMALTLATVAVNFTSGWHDIMPKRPGLSGAVSTVTRLTDYEQVTGAFTPARLCSFTATDASQVFETPLDGGALQDLVEQLARSLNELGGIAREAGSFIGLVESADHSAPRLAELLSQLPSFSDRCAYAGRDIPLMKRAQMAPATISREFGGHGPGRFTDLDNLTIFADNLVPHVLRLDGLLTYEPDLLDRVDAGELLTFGSPEEVEIRACGLHVVELLIDAIAARGRNINAADLDHALWTRGGAPAYKAHRRHRSRNPFY